MAEQRPFKPFVESSSLSTLTKNPLKKGFFVGSSYSQLVFPQRHEHQKVLKTQPPTDPLLGWWAVGMLPAALAVDKSIMRGFCGYPQFLSTAIKKRIFHRNNKK
jgi:hypothetical protein